jgi:hypothetical protein
MCDIIKGKINIFLFIGVSCFSINRMLCLLFFYEVNSRVQNTWKTHKKRANTQRNNNSSVLKEFKRFLTSDLCGLLLMAWHLDDL